MEFCGRLVYKYILGEIRKMKRAVIFFYLIVLPLIFSSCNQPFEEETYESTQKSVEESISEKNNSEEETNIKTESNEEEGMTETIDNQSIENLCVWPVYWDTDTIMSELEVMQDKINTVCYFAAYFDADNNPFIPDETLQTMQQINAVYGDKGWNTYLTFVNDKVLSDETSSLKDTQLLYDLLSQPDNREKHIDNILNMVTSNGFKGIEIDYEAIKSDMNLWQLYVTFIDELTSEAEKRDVDVRVVLEPNVPVDSLQFPSGPEYVVMCYNLYGYGTNPGPKADKNFLIEMAHLLDELPAPGNMAFSLGGFDFASDGTVAQLTEKECVDLLNASESTATRDNNSHDVVFQYQGSDGMTHEVWYADNDTLQFWMGIGKSCGYHRFSIWRLGRNVTLK